MSATAVIISFTVPTGGKIPTGMPKDSGSGSPCPIRRPGPFADLYDRPIFDPGYPVIDANVFWDSDGSVYLYYSRCCYRHSVESEVSEWARREGLYDGIEESWVYGVRMKPDFSGVIGEPVALLMPPATMDDPQSEWESRSVTSREVNRRWTEGSFLLKDNGRYYMMYSANYYGGQYYAVGYATSGSPLGPFVKSPDNPVLEKNTDRGGDVTGRAQHGAHARQRRPLLRVPRTDIGDRGPGA